MAVRKMLPDRRFWVGSADEQSPKSRLDRARTKPVTTKENVMKNQTAEFQLDLRTSEADAAFAQTSQLKPESFKSGFKFLIGEATKLFSTPTRRKIMTQEKQNSSVETSVAFTNTHAAKDSALRGSLKRGRNHLSVAALVMLLPNF